MWERQLTIEEQEELALEHICNKCTQTLTDPDFKEYHEEN